MKNKKDNSKPFTPPAPAPLHSVTVKLHDQRWLEVGNHLFSMRHIEAMTIGVAEPAAGAHLTIRFSAGNKEIIRTGTMAEAAALRAEIMGHCK